MPPSTLRDRRIALAIALLALAIYLTTTALRFQSIDEVAVFTVARNLAVRASFDGDILYWRQSIMGIGSIVADGFDGHSYVVKDVAPSLLSVPLIWLATCCPSAR